MSQMFVQRWKVQAIDLTTYNRSGEKNAFVKVNAVANMLSDLDFQKPQEPELIQLIDHLVGIDHNCCYNRLAHRWFGWWRHICRTSSHQCVGHGQPNRYWCHYSCGSKHRRIKEWEACTTSHSVYTAPILWEKVMAYEWARISIQILEMHLPTEIVYRCPTLYNTHIVFVSYGFTHISRLFG